jgi:ribosomal protein S18 acetylase RimI-like enzyme
MIAAPPLEIVAIDMARLDIIRALNEAIFRETRIINTFQRLDLLLLVAYVEGEPAGFKVGYQEGRHTFYSAKGGVLPQYRRRGVARALLFDMIERVRRCGYATFAYDTFPNKNPGMTVMGLQEGFRVTRADFNTHYRDYRIRLEIGL